MREIWRERGLRAYLGLVLFSLAGLTLSRSMRIDPGPIGPASALLTLGLGCLAVVRATERPIAALAVFAVGSLSEVLGLLTGFPFGAYAYSDRWWPTVALPQGHLFPLALPFAWMMVVIAAHGMVAQIVTFRPPHALIAGAVATLADLVMEPVMTGALGYWKWLEVGPLPGGAPLANAAGWFATASLASYGFHALGGRVRRSPVPAVVLAGHLLLTFGVGLIDWLT